MTKTLRRALILAAGAAVLASAILPAGAYCLTGVRWPDADRPAPILYNGSGKITSGQCFTGGTAGTDMDNAVKAGINYSGIISSSGNTSAKANRKDGINTLGWAKLGGGTLGVTNYLDYSRFYNCQSGGVRFADLFEADVRITTTYRWYGNQQCPCAAGPAFHLTSVSTHEFGHVIGLCHTNQPSSLMYPSFDVCEQKNKSNDETSGQNAIYSGTCSAL